MSRNHFPQHRLFLILGMTIAVLIGLGAAISVFTHFTKVIVTRPGFESVIVLDPPLLPPGISRWPDTAGAHRHFRYATAIPVKLYPEFFEKANVVTSDAVASEINIRVKLRIKDTTKLIVVAGQNWYPDEVESPIRAAVMKNSKWRMSGKGFDSYEAQRLFEIMVELDLNTFLTEKGLPISVAEIEYLGTSPNP